MKRSIHIRSLKTRESVKEISVNVPIPDRQRERLLMGILRNMNRDEYFVDDSELDVEEAGI